MYEIKNYYVPKPNPSLIFFYKLIVFLNAILLFGNVLNYNDRKSWTIMDLKYWTFVNLGLVAILILLDFKNQLKNLQRPIFKWVAFFLAVNCIWGFFSIVVYGNYPVKGADQFNQNMVAILNVFCLFIFIYPESVYEFARKCVLLLGIFGVGMNIYDFLLFDPEQFGPIIGRGAGFYYNATDSSFILCFGFVIAKDLVPSPLRLLYVAWLAVGIVLTQSRGGIGMFGLLLIFNFFSGKFPLSSIFTFVIVGGLALYVGYNYGLKDYQKEIIEYTRSFDNIAKRVQSLLTSTSRATEDDRVIVFREYVNLYKQKPILGNGIGAAVSNEWVGDTHAISSHNQFLNYMVDFGLMGMVLMLSFIWCMLYYKGTFLLYPDGLTFLFMFLIFANSNHLMFNTPCFLFTYAMFGRLLTLEYEKEHLLSY